MQQKSSFFYRFLKRIFDLVASFLLFVLLLPLFFFLMIWIFAVSPGRTFFVQKRFGRKGKIFTCFKFRTMTKDAPHNLPASAFAEPWRFYIKGGGLIRRLGLDELPQLINIFFGQMSFVGPRPVIQEEASLEKAREINGAANFRPGLTGYAQIQNRSCASNEEKAELDGFYAAHASLKLDWKIFWGTFGVLFQKKK